MKVVHVVLSLDVGGLERNVINQVGEGRSLGQEISVICVRQPGVLASEVGKRGGRLICLGKPEGIQISLFEQLRRVFHEIRPDIIHTHQIGSLFYAGPAALGQARVVHTEHGKEPYSTSLRKRWLGRLSGAFADLFFCLTSDMAGELIRNRIVPRRKIRVIDNGIDIDRFHNRGSSEDLLRPAAIPPGVPVIGTIGRLADVKCQDVLLRAFAEVRRIILDAHLLILGDGPLMSKLVQLAEQLGIRSGVHFLGYQEEAWRYLYIMDVFALTSRSEGMPQAVLEASIAGLPIVATRVGGLPEVIEDGRTGILVEPHDPATLSRALIQLLLQKEKAREMGQAARRLVESRFHIRRMAQVYHQHFIEILGLRSRRLDASIP